MPSTGHPISKDVPSSAIVKPPDPNSNVFPSTSSLRTTNNLPSTINLHQRVVPDFTVFCQTNFCLCQLPKEHDDLSESTKFKKIGNRFRPVPKNESLFTYHRINLKNIQQQTFEFHSTNSLCAS